MEDESVIDLNYAFAGYKKSKGVANPQRKADAKVPSCLLAFIMLRREHVMVQKMRN